MKITTNKDKIVVDYFVESVWKTKWRMGIHSHPLEIQALFYSALRCSWKMLIVNEVTKNLVAAINNCLSELLVHIKEYYFVEYEESERNIPLQDGGVHSFIFLPNYLSGSIALCYLCVNPSVDHLRCRSAVMTNTCLGLRTHMEDHGRSPIGGTT
ncbi:hypothetical protein Vadar_011011 [Vaccinium darrowii]|uniref:Uncharacterized protein n=1 Tax=Vaccinium darrowii TaxID=229202 RepID=A0ACB7ZIH1_9ERIC|nr:hypothetical protein Vadar_011011 [Vaccinium darrowii]